MSLAEDSTTQPQPAGSPPPSPTELALAVGKATASLLEFEKVPAEEPAPEQVRHQPVSNLHNHQPADLALPVYSEAPVLNKEYRLGLPNEGGLTSVGSPQLQEMQRRPRPVRRFTTPGDHTDLHAVYNRVYVMGLVNEACKLERQALRTRITDLEYQCTVLSRLDGLQLSPRTRGLTTNSLGAASMELEVRRCEMQNCKEKWAQVLASQLADLHAGLPLAAIRTRLSAFKMFNTQPHSSTLPSFLPVSARSPDGIAAIEDGAHNGRTLSFSGGANWAQERTDGGEPDELFQHEEEERGFDGDPYSPDGDSSDRDIMATGIPTHSGEEERELERTEEEEFEGGADDEEGELDLPDESDLTPTPILPEATEALAHLLAQNEGSD